MGIKRQNLSSGRVILLIVYTIAIIYFMFFGFGRPQINDTLEY